MKLTVVRQWFTNLSTCGELYIDGKFFCYTLERPLSPPSAPPFAIPEGIYSVTLEMSNHFKEIVPHINNVPGRTFIEIHPANYPTDVKGCIGVGNIHSQDFIGRSREAFSDLMSELTGQENIQIQVSNHVN